MEAVLAHTSRYGWTSQRHRGHASTRDVQCREILSVDEWVRASLRKRLWPQLAERHALDLGTFSLRDLFFVHYSAEEPRGQRGVGIHRDGTIVSFNILLNPASDFEGGGTYIESIDRTYTISQGDCFVHSGKVRHGGEPITCGHRYILVGFLDAVPVQSERGNAVVEIHTGFGDRKTRGLR